MSAPRSGLSRYGEYLGLGIQIAATMVLPLAGGLWLDNRLDTGPWFTLAGALLGVFSVLGLIFKIALYANQRSAKEQEDRRRRNQSNRT